MKLLKDFIMVKEPLEEEKKSAGGIIVSTDNTVKMTDPMVNEVEFVGPDVENISKGDSVLYLPKDGTPIKRKGGGYRWRLFKEDRIIAVVDSADEL